jgi:hypothetical protein
VTRGGKRRQEEARGDKRRQEETRGDKRRQEETKQPLTSLQMMQAHDTHTHAHTHTHTHAYLSADYASDVPCSKLLRCSIREAFIHVTCETAIPVCACI